MGNGRSRSVNHRGANNNDSKGRKNTMTEQNYPRHRLPPGSFFCVDLSLMDVSGEANDDPDAIDLLRDIQCGIWETACSAETFLKRPTVSSPEEARAVRKRVSRFLKTKDKYLALGSMLFKSRFFHEVCNHGSDSGNSSTLGEKQRRPVVELPTTEYRKPYMPLPSGWRKDSSFFAKEEDIFSFSVSHQFPFVGFARIKHEYKLLMTKGSNDSFVIGCQEIDCTRSPPIVGLDIVLFEKINPRLYTSEEEFLNVFRDQFTPNEWENGIQQLSETIRLREFYVRWAMKEAYTKAIGVGMGLEFNSFEIHLEGNEEDDTASDTSIWSHISKNQELILEATRPVCFRGTIVFTNKSENEYFFFYFLPLVSNSADVIPMEGCACVCVGSFWGKNPQHDNSDEKWKTQINISWTDLEGLVQSHQNQ